jgi:signal transduction histidine kinase
MLRKLKIGSRVNLLVVVPLIALSLLAAATVIAVQRASLRGDNAKRLITAEQFRADILPPPASLLNAWTLVNHMTVLMSDPGDATEAEIPVAVAEIKQFHAVWNERMAFWQQASIDKNVTNSLLGDGLSAGQDFWSVVEGDFFTAIQLRDEPAAIAAIRTMEPFLDKHQLVIDESVVSIDTEVAAARDSADSFVSMVLKAILLAAAVLLAGLGVLALRVRRSIVGPIKRLSERARKVARDELPTVVRSVQRMEEGAAAPEIAPFVIDSQDELAELAESFTSVQGAAVTMAVEQATARRVVSANLINVARRNQSLLERTLRYITELERNERDPDALEQLFQLDHLTTRMRRQAQSLLVLAGAHPNKLWSAPIDAGDIVRIALSQVEDYAKVTIGDNGNAKIAGASASDIAHLLAELIDNATAFSPPGAEIKVLGRTSANGHMFAVIDYGIGLSQAELVAANSRLLEVTDFDREASRTLGLQVVARLAARQGIAVRFADTAGGMGVTAIVELPKALLVEFDTNSTSVPRQLPAPTGTAVAPTFQAPAAERPRVPQPAPSKDQLEEMFRGPAETVAPQAVPAVTVPAVTVPAVTMPAVTMVNGMAKRVRGAQMPDLGKAAAEFAGNQPTPDEVRARLSSLQRGVSQGREAIENQQNGGS